MDPRRGASPHRTATGFQKGEGSRVAWRRGPRSGHGWTSQKIQGRGGQPGHTGPPRTSSSEQGAQAQACRRQTCPRHEVPPLEFGRMRTPHPTSTPFMSTNGRHCGSCEQGRRRKKGSQRARGQGCPAPRPRRLTQMSCFSPMGKLEYKSTISGVLYMGVVFLVI